jgi:hypothetical protein
MAETTAHLLSFVRLYLSLFSLSAARHPFAPFSRFRNPKSQYPCLSGRQANSKVSFVFHFTCLNRLRQAL